jgi:hypothetical protein
MKLKLPKQVLQVLNYPMIFDFISILLVLLVTLAGHATQQMVLNGKPAWWVTEFNLSTLLAFASVFLFSGAIFILNQINHRETKAKSNKISPIETGEVDPGIAKKIAVVAIIIGLAALLLFQKLLLVGLAIVMILFRGLLHNVLKISKKESGILWIIFNLVFAALLFIFGWMIKGAFNPGQWQYFMPYLLQSLSLLILIFLLNGNRLYKSYKDGEEIIHMGDRKLLIWFASLLAAAAFYVGLKNNDPLISHSLLLSLVLYIILVFKLNHLWILRTVAYTILFFVFFISSQYPWFFFFAVIVYYLSKKYYHDKYGILFPNFGNIEETGAENDQVE